MFCVKCGKDIAENSAFCPICGARQATIYREVLVRGPLSESDFIANINRWFQWHPAATNVSCKFETGTSLGLLANKSELNRIVIEYELGATENPRQYALVKEESIALARKDTQAYIANWKQTHPNVRVDQWTGSTHTRGHMLSHLLDGLGAMNRMNMYILFHFPRKQPAQTAGLSD